MRRLHRPPKPPKPPKPPRPVPGPPAVPPAPAQTLYVDPVCNCAAQAAAWKISRPADSAAMAWIAEQPRDVWVGGWIRDLTAYVDALLTRAAGQLVGLVAYNIPGRDFGNFSSAGAAVSRAAYATWIAQLAAGIKGRPVTITLEPDSLAMIPKALADNRCTAAQAAERKLMLADAVQVLIAAGAEVYLDAGDSNWIGAAAMADLLAASGFQYATGLVTNVSHNEFVGAESAFALDILARLAQTNGIAKSYLIDTSRCGLGAYDPLPGEDERLSWCNAPGRALGPLPTLDPAKLPAGCKGYHWIKGIGESDGSIQPGARNSRGLLEVIGAPSAGTFMPEKALELFRLSVHAKETP